MYRSTEVVSHADRETVVHEYNAALVRATANDPALRAALLNADYSAVATLQRDRRVQDVTPLLSIAASQLKPAPLRWCPPQEVDWLAFFARGDDAKEEFIVALSTLLGLPEPSADGECWPLVDAGRAWTRR